MVLKQPDNWNIVLFAPDEAEVSLLAELAERQDARLLAVIDPDGHAVGSAIAEVMGTPILQQWDPGRLSSANWLVHPAESPLPENLSAAAAASGIRIASGPVFRKAFAAGAESSAEPGDESSSELEPTEDVHRTLSRIEEALDRDSLLRWLLSLVTRAVDADEGSIMLLDEKTDELYVAFSYGLSDEIFLGTRVGLGEGIAGEVARTRTSRVITGKHDLDMSQDRNDISAAICAPLITGGRLMGVINVNVTGGMKTLGVEQKATVDRLAGRMALILNRFLTIQKAKAAELFREIDDQLRDLSHDTGNLETILAAWAGTLAMGLEAKSLSIALACADGSLFVGEGSIEGDTRVYYAPLENPAWREVFENGRPLVVRQTEGTAPIGEDLTLFYLPVGHRTVLAVLTVVFPTQKSAHAFNKVSSEYLALLEQRLGTITGRIDLEDRLQRMSSLADVLGDIAGRRDEDIQVALGRLRAGACLLTGAAGTCVVVGDGPDGVEIAAPDSVEDSPWLGDAGRLLDEARERGWIVTVLAGDAGVREQQVCLMAVPADDRKKGAGLVMWQKTRIHQLDGEVFTDFDAELAGHLARLAPMLLSYQDRTASLNTELARDIPDVTDFEASDASPDVEPASGHSEIPLLAALRREMDRSDRYHSPFALNAFRASPTLLWDESMTTRLLDSLGSGVRSSDYVFSRPDGTILMITPEDVQSLGKLHTRIVELLRGFAGGDYCEIVTAKAIYPGNYEGPEALLRAVCDKLDH